MIVSADTLVYFGALDDVIAAAAAALAAGRLLRVHRRGARPRYARPTGSPKSGAYCLRPHGRYNHSRAYVERTLVNAGLHPVIARAELRLEAGAPVDGLVVRAEKREAVSVAAGNVFGEHHV